MAGLIGGAAFAIVLGLAGQASANGYILSSNGTTQIGMNDDGSLDASTPAGTVGIGYNFTGQGGRNGMQDALTPGCLCEAWGVAANGVSGFTGDAVGNSNITVHAATGGTGSGFTSNTELGSTGLTVSQTITESNSNGGGSLFEASIVIHNGTGAVANVVRFARAMDWDVPPTEFHEYVTVNGTATTSTLLHSTDDGFANADPINDMGNSGLGCGVTVDTDFQTGPCDHGALFIFGFGNLADGADYKFNIFYGAADNERNALLLLGAVGPELYDLGQSSFVDATGGCCGPRRPDLPTYIFAFNGVGGSVVVPPGVPEPATWAMMLLGFGGLGAALRQRRRQAALA